MENCTIHEQTNNDQPVCCETNKGRYKRSRGNLSILTIALSVFLSALVGYGSGYYSQKSQEQPVLYTAPITTTIAANPTSGNLSIIDVAALTSETIVEITAETISANSFLFNSIGKGAGSGVIITTDGYIVTNNHVIADSTKIGVRLKDGTTHDAVIVGTDTRTDIALLKINATGLQAAVFGDSSKLLVGEGVVAIGNPLGQLGGTVTNGIISALDREITIDNESMRLLQTNAAINPGNSGGGLFNMRAELVGVVNAKSSGLDIEGLGFAIPSNDAKAVIEDLMEYGYVKGRVQLGVSLVSITTPQAAMNYRVSNYGLYIQDVQLGSAAKEADLRVGDRIVSFHGKTIVSYSDLKSVLDTLSVGQSVSIVVERDGSKLTKTITLQEYRPANIPTNKG